MNSLSYGGAAGMGQECNKLYIKPAPIVAAQAGACQAFTYPYTCDNPVCLETCGGEKLPCPYKRKYELPATICDGENCIPSHTVRCIDTVNYKTCNLFKHVECPNFEYPRRKLISDEVLATRVEIASNVPWIDAGKSVVKPASHTIPDSSGCCFSVAPQYLLGFRFNASGQSTLRVGQSQNNSVSQAQNTSQVSQNRMVNNIQASQNRMVNNSQVSQNRMVNNSGTVLTTVATCGTCANTGTAIVDYDRRGPPIIMQMSNELKTALEYRQNILNQYPNCCSTNHRSFNQR